MAEMELELVKYDTGLVIYLDGEQVAGVEPTDYKVFSISYYFTESELEKVRAKINYVLRFVDNDE